MSQSPDVVEKRVRLQVVWKTGVKLDCKWFDMKNEAVGVDEDNFTECVAYAGLVCGPEVLDGLLSDSVAGVRRSSILGGVNSVAARGAYLCLEKLENCL